MPISIAFILFLIGVTFSVHSAEIPAYIWLEAEEFGPLKGGNFSFQHWTNAPRESWSVAGPGVAAEWTMGGESEWMSIAARPDLAQEIKVSAAAEVPGSGDYRLLVRYADYRQKKEEFGIRLRQNGRTTERLFGKEARVDELDPMKVLWDWAFAWDEAPVSLQKGLVEIEIFAGGITEARRAVDCICLTTDPSYHPHGREKPPFAPWRTLQQLRNGALRIPGSGAPQQSGFALPREWRLTRNPPAFLWNVDQNWEAELLKQERRIDVPFGVDPPLTPEFLATFRDKAPPVYSDGLSGPVLSISRYPVAFTNNSPFLAWLKRNPERRFALLLNYNEPAWFKGADRPEIYANLKQAEKQFVGFIAGESIAYTNPDESTANAKIKAAKSRQEILAILRKMQDKATTAKFSNYFGQAISSAEAWRHVIPCLSANMEAYCHLLCGLGVQRIGHENTGNSPTLARRLAFLRGACRQFGAQFVNYQSCNLGDAATMFSRQSFLYPGSSRYVFDNQYDVWAGAGHHWLLKDYLLWGMAGVDAFYNEQGVDMFWKPGGNSAGDDFPIELSPKGKTAEAAQKIIHAHPRGTPYAPVAFLLDEAHGWSQERFTPGAFGLDPSLNPALLRPNFHEAAIRGWFDTAYFPAPETQNEPSSAIRQTFVAGMFGDIFDVIVTASNRTATVRAYPVLVAAGEVWLTAEWGKALREYMQAGGTLVACAEQFSGPGTSELNLPEMGSIDEASSFRWAETKTEIAAQTFRFRPVPGSQDRVVATAKGQRLTINRKVGSGSLLFTSVPLGLGLDRRPLAVLGLVLNQLATPLLPVRISGDVEWALNKTDAGSWVVLLFNNNGYIKPQHGVLPTDHSKDADIIVKTSFKLSSASEWIRGERLQSKEVQSGAAELKVSVPAAGVRIVELIPRQ